MRKLMRVEMPTVRGRCDAIKKVQKHVFFSWQFLVKAHNRPKVVRRISVEMPNAASTLMRCVL